MLPAQDPPDGPSAQYFKKVAPAFSLELQPKKITFQFLDHSDPDRSTVVRRKAREWVNKGKEEAEKNKEGKQRRAKTRFPRHVQGERIHVGQQSRSVPRSISELRSFDAFGTLPQTQKDCYHIIQYCRSLLVSSCSGSAEWNC